MFRKQFEEACTWLSGQGENIKRYERSYKGPGAEQVRLRLNGFLDGTRPGKVNVQPQKVLNLLGWQVVDGLNVMANTYPERFRQALTILWTQPLDPHNADRFWSELDPALDILTPAQLSKFNGAGTRASVASYFLFVAEPEEQPFYRPSFGGKAINWLYGRKDALDARTLGSLLVDYTHRCRYLQREFHDAGILLVDMIDTQSALYILAKNYIGKKSKPGTDK